VSILLENPYAETAGKDYVWLRGNLHTHTTHSDGGRDPQAVIDVYAARGYQFLALSDHDCFSDYTKLNSRGMVLVPGSEISAAGNHMLHIGGRGRVEPSADRQKAIDDANKSGGIVIVCHPDWQQHFDHCPYETLAALQGYSGVEIFNSGIVDTHGSPLAVNKWDMLLSIDRFVWAHGTDDSHGARHDCRSWDVVRVAADQVTPDGIVAALARGSFYVSTGVTIERIEIEGSKLRVVASDAEAIEVIGQHGQRLHFVEKTETCFDAGDVISPYVRVQCYGFADRMAWTQPFIIRGGQVDRLRELLAEKRSLRALRLKRATPPRNVDDPLWAKAPEADLSCRNPLAQRPAAETKIRCVVTERHLVFTLRCAEPLLEKLKTNCRDGDANMWTDDSIEVFLDLDRKGNGYFQIMANAAGRHWAVHTKDPRLKPKCVCKATRGRNEWTLQMSIPLSSLGPDAKVKPGTRWGFHVCRNRTPKGETSFFKWTGGSNHNPTAFWSLEF
jgi:hypothetical protein